ncbi:MAG: hypothetical protein AB1571_02925 [Nanoarchaeota archaeon]
MKIKCRLNFQFKSCPLVKTIRITPIVCKIAKRIAVESAVAFTSILGINYKTLITI